MDKGKLALDILSGILIPIAVGLLTILWKPKDEDRRRIWSALVRRFVYGLAVILLLGIIGTAYGIAFGFYSEKPVDPLAALTAEQKRWFLKILKKSDDPNTAYEQFF